MFERSCAIAVGHPGLEIVRRHLDEMEKNTGRISMADDKVAGAKERAAR
jgi:hypothetical protein